MHFDDTKLNLYIKNSVTYLLYQELVPVLEDLAKQTKDQPKVNKKVTEAFDNLRPLQLKLIKERAELINQGEISGTYRLTIAETADILLVKPERLRKQISRGYLPPPHREVGCPAYYLVKELDELEALIRIKPNKRKLTKHE